MFEDDLKFPTSDLAESSEKQVMVCVSRGPGQQPCRPSSAWRCLALQPTQLCSGVALRASDQWPLSPPLSLAPACEVPVSDAQLLPSLLLSFLPGFAETFSTQPRAKDTIRQKSGASMFSPVSIVEAGPQADSGSSLCACGGELQGSEPGQAQVQFLHLPVLQLPEPLLHLAEAYLWLPVPPGH